jgi:hypothetical protein
MEDTSMSRWSIALLLAFSACSGAPAHQGPTPVACPESVSVSCATEMVCTYDDVRQCELCQCDAPTFVEYEHDKPEGKPRLE